MKIYPPPPQNHILLTMSHKYDFYWRTKFSDTCFNHDVMDLYNTVQKKLYSQSMFEQSCIYVCFNKKIRFHF